MPLPILAVGPILAAAGRLLKSVPWRVWLLLAFFVAVVAAQLYLRHKWINEGRAESQQKLEQCQALTGQLSDAVRAQNAENAKRIADAKRQKEEAAKAVAAANEAADRLVNRMAAINRQMAEAQKDPACKQLLEQRVCVAIR